jgi:hypothetical protein
MEDRIVDLLSLCSQIDFGPVNLAQEEEKFRGELNQEMLSFCEFLPRSMQTEAALFLVQYLRTSFADGLNFVRYFYVPAWSILYWLIQSCPDNKTLDPKLIANARTGHVMAMFLHAFDDHLTDGQLPITHLALLIRSQSWMLMSQAFERLAEGVDKGPAIVRGFIDDYYSSIGKSGEMKSLDDYCNFFRKQMATWLIVPVLLARGISGDEGYTRSIQAAYGSFGIAWRLLDDLQDIEKDMAKGTHSSIYVSLNKDLRGWWDKDPEEKKDHNNGYVQSILNYVLENRVIDSIKERTCSELKSAASLADSCCMPGLANELRWLLRPLRNRQDRS